MMLSTYISSTYLAQNGSLAHEVQSSSVVFKQHLSTAELNIVFVACIYVTCLNPIGRTCIVLIACFFSFCSWIFNR